MSKFREKFTGIFKGRGFQVREKTHMKATCGTENETHAIGEENLKPGNESKRMI